MKCSEIMNPNVVVTDPDAPICDVAAKMRDSQVGFIAVCKENRPIGVVTDRDITVRACASALNGRSTCVREVMTPEVVSCRVDADLQRVEHLMVQRRISRVLIVDDDDRLAGVLSLVDVLHFDNPLSSGVVAQRVTEREFRQRPIHGKPSA